MISAILHGIAVVIASVAWVVLVLLGMAFMGVVIAAPFIAAFAASVWAWRWLGL